MMCVHSCTNMLVHTNVQHSVYVRAPTCLRVCVYTVDGNEMDVGFVPCSDQCTADHV